MRRNKLIGTLFISMGILVLLYKKSGFYGWGGYVDKTWENLIISSILIIIGLLLFKRRKVTK